MAIAVECDADRVEADLPVARRRAPPFGQPGGGEATDLSRLAGPDGVNRALRAEAGVLAAGLDLDEDERGAVEGNDVELAVAGAGVALEHLPVRGAETVGDDLLGGTAGALAG